MVVPKLERYIPHQLALVFLHQLQDSGGSGRRGGHVEKDDSVGGIAVRMGLDIPHTGSVEEVWKQAVVLGHERQLSPRQPDGLKMQLGGELGLELFEQLLGILHRLQLRLISAQPWYAGGADTVILFCRIAVRVVLMDADMLRRAKGWVVPLGAKRRARWLEKSWMEAGARMVRRMMGSRRLRASM